MTVIFIILATMSVPLFAIGSKTYLRAKEIEAQGGGNGALQRELEDVRRETRELKARIEVLETIAVDGKDLASARSESETHAREFAELEAAARRSR